MYLKSTLKMGCLEMHISAFMHRPKLSIYKTKRFFLTYIGRNLGRYEQINLTLLCGCRSGRSVVDFVMVATHAYVNTHMAGIATYVMILTSVRIATMGRRT